MLIWNELPLAGRWVSHYLVSSKHLCLSVSGNDESCSVTDSAASPVIWDYLIIRRQ